MRIHTVKQKFRGVSLRRKVAVPVWWSIWSSEGEKLHLVLFKTKNHIFWRGGVIV